MGVLIIASKRPSGLTVSDNVSSLLPYVQDTTDVGLRSDDKVLVLESYE